MGVGRGSRLLRVVGNWGGPEVWKSCVSRLVLSWTVVVLLPRLTLGNFKGGFIFAKSRAHGFGNKGICLHWVKSLGFKTLLDCIEL